MKTTVGLRRTDDIAAFNVAYAKRFPVIRPLARTVRADLMIDAALLEIEAVARQC